MPDLACCSVYLLTEETYHKTKSSTRDLLIFSRQSCWELYSKRWPPSPKLLRDRRLITESVVRKAASVALDVDTTFEQGESGDRHEANHEALRRVGQTSSRNLQRDIEVPVGPDGEVAYAAELREDRFLVRDAVAGDLEPPELLASERAHKEVVPPLRITIAAVEDDAAWPDRRGPVDDGLFHPFLRGLGDTLLNAVADYAPAVVAPGLQAVKLLLAA